MEQIHVLGPLLLALQQLMRFLSEPVVAVVVTAVPVAVVDQLIHCLLFHFLQIVQ
jgi:hypothetical protein